MEPLIQSEEWNVDDGSRVFFAVQTNVSPNLPCRKTDEVSRVGINDDEGVFTRRSSPPVPLAEELGQFLLIRRGTAVECLAGVAVTVGDRARG